MGGIQCTAQQAPVLLKRTLPTDATMRCDSGGGGGRRCRRRCRRHRHRRKARARRGSPRVLHASMPARLEGGNAPLEAYDE